MFVLDSLFVGGLRFVLEKIADVADRELNDPERWRAMLLEAQLAHENGEITRRGARDARTTRSSHGCVISIPMPPVRCCRATISKASRSSADIGDSGK